VAFFIGGLVATELGLRLLDPDYLWRLFGEEASTVYSETYGWDLRKGFGGTSFGTTQTVNRLGYRGSEHPLARVPGRKRVLMVGDSIAYGAGVRDNETFSALLERRDPDLEVVNISVGGYGTDQELLKLQHEGLRFRPDLVILHFCLFSDFYDNSQPFSLWDSRQPKPFFAWDGSHLVLYDAHVRLSPLRRCTQWLADNSHLYNRIRRLLNVPEPPRERGKARARSAEVRRHFNVAADLTFRLIRRMNELTQQSGARFLVVIHPDRDNYAHPTRFLRAFCGAPLLEGIPIVDLGDRYRAAGLSFDELALDEAGHLTPHGHQVAVEALETLISKPVPSDWDYLSTCRAARRAEADAGVVPGRLCSVPLH
jgi:hypothetical protein